MEGYEDSERYRGFILTSFLIDNVAAGSRTVKFKFDITEPNAADHSLRTTLEAVHLEHLSRFEEDCRSTLDQLLEPTRGGDISSLKQSLEFVFKAMIDGHRPDTPNLSSDESDPEPESDTEMKDNTGEEKKEGSRDRTDLHYVAEVQESLDKLGMGSPKQPSPDPDRMDTQGLGADSEDPESDEEDEYYLRGSIAEDHRSGVFTMRLPTAPFNNPRRSLYI